MNSPHHTVVCVSDACIHVPAYLRKIVGPFGTEVIRARPELQPVPAAPERASFYAVRVLAVIAFGAAFLQISGVI